MTLHGYYLGCPMWGLKSWVGHLFARDARPRDYLRQYASVFNTVEGNTTFYSLPDAETVARWAEQAPAHFRFCFKLPRTITHERRLRNAHHETGKFLRRLEPLRDRLGPLMIQLPPSFGPESLSVLERFLDGLPRERSFAVELRHRAFYSTEDAARQIDERLGERGCERVIMDTLALRSGDPDDPDVAAAQHKKPDLPVYPVALGHSPMLRFVGHPDLGVTLPRLETWLPILDGWIAEGRSPYVFIHLPNNREAPDLARIWHASLSRHRDLGKMPVWPSERREEASGQLRLL